MPYEYIDNIHAEPINHHSKTGKTIFMISSIEEKTLLCHIVDRGGEIKRLHLVYDNIRHLSSAMTNRDSKRDIALKFTYVDDCPDYVLSKKLPNDMLFQYTNDVYQSARGFYRKYVSVVEKSMKKTMDIEIVDDESSREWNTIGGEHIKTNGTHPYDSIRIVESGDDDEDEEDIQFNYKPTIIKRNRKTSMELIRECGSTRIPDVSYARVELRDRDKIRQLNNKNLDDIRNILQRNMKLGDRFGHNTPETSLSERIISSNNQSDDSDGEETSDSTVLTHQFDYGIEKYEYDESRTEYINKELFCDQRAFEVGNRVIRDNEMKKSVCDTNGPVLFVHFTKYPMESIICSSDKQFNRTFQLYNQEINSCFQYHQFLMGQAQLQYYYVKYIIRTEKKLYDNDKHVKYDKLIDESEFLLSIKTFIQLYYRDNLYMKCMLTWKNFTLNTINSWLEHFKKSLESSVQSEIDRYKYQWVEANISEISCFANVIPVNWAIEFNYKFYDLFFE